MPRLKPNAGKSYKRSPVKNSASTRQQEQPVAGPSTGQPTASTSRTPDDKLSQQNDLKRKDSPSGEALTREAVEKLFGNEEEATQAWEEIDLTGDDDEEDGANDAGDDNFEDEDDAETPAPANAHDIARQWTDQLVTDLFGTDGSAKKDRDVAYKALRLWPTFARLMANYDSQHLTYSKAEGLQPRPGVKSRSFAEPFFENIAVTVDQTDLQMQRGALIFTWMLVHTPEWQEKFWTLNENNYRDWYISFEEIKRKNSQKKMLASSAFGVYTLIDDGGYIGVTFTEFWVRLLRHLYSAVSRKMARARARRALSKWACLTVFEVPKKYRDNVPHLAVYLVETFWNAITRAAEGKNLNTNKMDSSGWAALATRKTIRRGMLKTWELLSEPIPGAKNAFQVEPKILTKDWIRGHPELIDAFGVGAIGAVIQILTGKPWSWYIRTLRPIPIPAEAYPSLRLPTAWREVAERQRFLDEKKKRHDDVLYSYLQQQLYNQDRRRKRARKSDEQKSAYFTGVGEHTPRNFASTPNHFARGGPIKVAPDFSWRRPFRGTPAAPNVTLVTTDFDADAILETLTSKRVAIDAEPGKRPNISVGAMHRSWSDTYDPIHSLRDGVFCIADGDGVILLWLAKMKRLPRRLKALLEDPDIEKETIGAHWFVRTVLNESDFFATRPEHIICLRYLAEIGWPYIAEDDSRMTHDQWVLKFSEQAFETRHAVQCKQTGFHVDSLSKETLELLINRAWFAFCLGHEARQRIADRLGGKVDRDRTLLRMLAESVMSPERIKKELVEKATAQATFNADVVEAQRKFKQHREKWLEEMRRQNGR
ncbi:hypothetical protein JCM10908_006002 [Rhodotorula pacifica]|uniref:uncharacterized protein n=1 Tax=Rhodotorula pacifica TaxID=1495444 RepID=UPI00317497CD